MQSSARTIAILVLQSLLAASAFAGDANKPANNPPTNEASASEPQAQAAPTPAPKAKKSSSSSSSSDSMRGPNTPGGELFLGYSYVRFNATPALTPGGATVTEHFDMIPGGIATITGNINNWFGLTADFAGYGLHDVGNVNGKLFTYLFGPRFAMRRGKWVVFGDALGGGARVTSTLKGIPDTRFFNRSFHSNAAAMAAGGGVDFNASKHVGIRLGEAEYLMTTFSDNHNDRQNNLRLSGGLVFRFGFPAAAPPPVHHPPTATCSATPSTVHLEMNEVAVIRAEATSPDGRPLTYTWSATGGTVDGTGPEVRWNPGTAAVGS